MIVTLIAGLVVVDISYIMRCVTTFICSIIINELRISITYNIAVNITFVISFQILTLNVLVIKNRARFYITIKITVNKIIKTIKIIITFVIAFDFVL